MKHSSISPSAIVEKACDALRGLVRVRSELIDERFCSETLPALWENLCRKYNRSKPTLQQLLDSLAAGRDTADELLGHLHSEPLKFGPLCSLSYAGLVFELVRVVSDEWGVIMLAKPSSKPLARAMEEAFCRIVLTIPEDPRWLELGLRKELLGTDVTSLDFDERALLQAASKKSGGPIKSRDLREHLARSGTAERSAFAKLQRLVDAGYLWKPRKGEFLLSDKGLAALQQFKLPRP